MLTNESVLGPHIWDVVDYVFPPQVRRQDGQGGLLPPRPHTARPGGVLGASFPRGYPRHSFSPVESRGLLPQTFPHVTPRECPMLGTPPGWSGTFDAAPARLRAHSVPSDEGSKRGLVTPRLPRPPPASQGGTQGHKFWGERSHPPSHALVVLGSHGEGALLLPKNTVPAVSSLAVSPQGDNSFVVMTNFIITPGQKQGTCPEVSALAPFSGHGVCNSGG